MSHTRRSPSRLPCTQIQRIPLQRTKGWKSENSCTVNIPRRRTIHGISSKIAAATAARRGTVETVISCSEVNTCATLISKPTTTAEISSGAPIHSAVSIVCRSSATIWSEPMTHIPHAKVSSSLSQNFCSRKTFHQRPHQQVPAIHHDEQQNLQWRRNNHRRQLHHADRRGDRRHHQIDHQEGKKQRYPNLESRLQFRKDVSRHHHPHGNVFSPRRARRLRQFQKQRQVFFAGIPQHEVAQRWRSQLQRFERVGLPVLKWHDRGLVNRAAHRLHQKI